MERLSIADGGPRAPQRCPAGTAARRLRQGLAGLALLLAASPGVARGARPAAWAVGTFESLGIYYNTAAAAARCPVYYRPAGSGRWRQAYPLVYDRRLHQFRGSLVNLRPGTPYDIQLRPRGGRIRFRARTMSERFLVGKITRLAAGTTSRTVRITEPGTAKAWHLVEPAPGGKFVSDVFNLSDYNIVVAADYVILRGLELKNAAIDGILIRSGVQHVVIEDCHITGWGRIGGARAWGVLTGSDSAIYGERGAGHLVIQRNLLDNPRGGANDWESGHPNGPQAISLNDSAGGNVIRYNTIRSTEDHGFNDGIGGSRNYSFQGSPNRDSDIYGNLISNCWDDAIESEGANCNVRIWSNYIHHTFVDIATAATAMGPLYIFRNVFGTSRVSHQDHAGGFMIKTGMNYITLNGRRVSTGLGYRFIFHNTALQPNGPLHVFSRHELHHAVTRNNIFYCHGRAYPPDRGAPGNDFRNDLTGDYIGGGLIRSLFLPSESPEWFLAPTMKHIRWGKLRTTRNGRRLVLTDPLVEIPNPAIDAGARLPGFNDDYTGAAPDIGAYETGRPPLRFGREMAPGFRRPPWERY